MASDKSDEAPTVPEPLHEPRVTIDSVLAMDAERYQPLGVLGKGGMGEVQLCKDTRIARDVAMKTLRAKYRDQSGYRERFLFEARLQGQLEHPSIVPVHDLGVTRDGELYFTMKRIRGITLAKALANVRDGIGAYSRRRLLSAFSNVCLAVDFAHARGVVHRDLKPHNIMLGDFGEVYILDWGIAKLVDRTDTPLGQVVELPGSDSQTRAGATLGTPPYIAPEREAGQPADARSDVYSLGVILAQIVESDDDIAPELAAIANRASAKDVAVRYRSARELHDALERFLDGDRDLEARRKAATEHVARAEQALGRKDRTATAREVGRALGLDPSNARALRILMRLLSDVPNELPAAAQEEIDRRWLTRRGRTMRIGAVSTAALLVAVPFLLWMGIRNWIWVARVDVSVDRVAAAAQGVVRELVHDADHRELDADELARLTRDRARVLHGRDRRVAANSSRDDQRRAHAGGRVRVHAGAVRADRGGSASTHVFVRRRWPNDQVAHARAARGTDAGLPDHGHDGRRDRRVDL
jgi:eukaryotic-like serine/threonine-protein kinase